MHNNFKALLKVYLHIFVLKQNIVRGCEIKAGSPLEFSKSLFSLLLRALSSPPSPTSHSPPSAASPPSLSPSESPLAASYNRRLSLSPKPCLLLALRVGLLNATHAVVCVDVWVDV